MKNSRFIKSFPKAGLVHEINSRITLFSALLLGGLFLLGANNVHGFSFSLQGQDAPGAGNTNWNGGPLNGWKELDFVPCRTFFNGGPATNALVTVTFDHTKGSTHGIQGLFNFTPSSGVTIVEGPTLIAPINEDNWTYTFRVDLTTANGDVEFFARLSSGSHLFPGASMHMESPPLQIVKPGPTPGNPSLAVQKTGPKTAQSGDLITYTVTFTNKADASIFGAGVQLSDMLPSVLTYVGTIVGPPPTITGNTLTWDLGDLAIGASGSVSYQARLTTNAIIGSTFTNFAQILSSQDETDFSDNISTNVTTVVNETNHPPTFGLTTDSVIVLEDAGPQSFTNFAINISAGATNESTQILTFEIIASSNPGLFVAAPRIEPDGTLTFRSADNAFGSNVLTVVLRDDGATNNTSTPTNFTIAVLPVNDAPSFVKGPDVIVDQSAGPQAFTNWATSISPGPANESDQTVKFFVSDDNASLFFSDQDRPSIDSSGTLTFRPAPGAEGITTVSVFLRDDGGTANGGVDTSATSTFTITVTKTNGPPPPPPPTFTTQGDQTIDEDSGDQNISTFVTAFVATSPVFIVTNDNTNLFNALEQPRIIPTSGTTAGLLYNTRQDSNGVANVTIILLDGTNQSAPQTFKITVNPINDPPSFTPGPNIFVTNNVGSVVTNWASNISAGPPNESYQSVDFHTSNDNELLFTEQPTNTPTGTLLFTPSPSRHGTATVTVVLHDSEDGYSQTNTFLITVLQAFVPSNQPPIVTITNPVDGAVFTAPALIPINVIATDPDPQGFVAKVEFFEGTNKLSETTDPAPYFFVWSNVPPGSYVLTARATDNLNAMATSAPVNITVVSNTVITNQVPFGTNEMIFSLQTGLWHQKVFLTNNTESPMSAVRLSVLSVKPTGAYVYNTNGMADGLPYIQFNQTLQPHAGSNLLVQIYGKGTNAPMVVYKAEAVSQAPPPTPDGTPVPFDRWGLLEDGTFLLRFLSAANKTYFVQYSDEVDSVGVRTSPITVRGNGGAQQWIDFGPPATESLPGAGNRFYQIIEATQTSTLK